MRLNHSLAWLSGVTILFLCPAVSGEEQKNYPISLKVLETTAISYRPDGTRSTTTCTSNGPDNFNCESTTTSASQHTDLVSFADLSDGKLYMISCILGTGRRFLTGFGQGMAASAGAATVSGCPVPPGVYKARWEKGRLKVLHESHGQAKETTFVVLNSAPMPTKESRPEGLSALPEKTLLLLSSTPTGAEIQIDGVFVGQTPSSIPTLPGEHFVQISKTGYRAWTRKIATNGGQVTIAAELDPEPK